MMFHFFHGAHRGPHIFAWLIIAVLIAAVVFGVIALTRSLRRPQRGMQGGESWSAPGPQSDPALTELRVRYARGDITWDDYVQRAANLGHPIAPGADRPGDPTQPPAPFPPPPGP